MGTWYKNIQLYGNINKFMGCFFIIALCLLGVLIWLWVEYILARVIISIILGLIFIGLFSKLVRWTLKCLGINSYSHHR